MATKQLPKLFTRADILPETVNEENRTFDIIWSTGAIVHRNHWSEPFRESLSLEKRHVRLGRLNGGAPFLDSHDAWDTSGVIGKIVEGSAKVDGKEGRATVKFSDRNEKIRGLWQDINAGILKNTSVGYRVYKYRDVTEIDDKTKHLRAIDWEPMEASLVPIGADPGAQVRSDQEEQLYSVIIEGESRKMGDNARGKQETPAQAPPVEVPKETKKETRAENSPPEVPPVDMTKVRQEAAQAERKRISDINLACRVAKMDAEFTRKLIDDGTMIDQARAMIFDRLAEQSDQTETKNHVRVEQTGLDHTVTRRAAIEGALMNRFDGKKYELPEPAREYRQMSLLELARRSLEWAGFTTIGVGKSDIAIRALSTSDFPNLLANVLNKTLRESYIQTPQTFLPFVRGVEAPDFKEMQRTGFGESPKLKRVYEDGEITYAKIVETAEKYSLATYARGIVVTRVAIINDDLNGFMRIGRGFGQQVKHLESDLVWGVITDNDDMGDGTALFHADHGNLAAAGAAISETTLSAAVQAMMKQTGLDGETKIQIIPSYLVVPVALRTIAKKFLSTNLVPVTAATVNIFAGEFNLVTEVRLDDTSESAWYLFSDVANTNDMIEMAKLDGQAEPQLLQKEPSGVDGMKVECVYDVVAKAIDHRPFYRNDGS